MAAGRIEINLVRLLSRCETRASEQKTTDWRLEKYLNVLNDYLCQLRQLSANQPSAEQLSDYTRRIELLRGIADAEKLPTSSEKSLAVDLLVPSKMAASVSKGSRDLHIQTKAKYLKDMRDELIGSGVAGDREGGLRQRVMANGSSREDEEETLLRHHNQMHEKVTEEILYLANSLKENAKAAGRVVKDDNEKLTDSSRQADTNFGKLKVESARLDVHVQKACSWWIWITLLLVIATFIWMVIFMKMFPKK